MRAVKVVLPTKDAAAYSAALALGTELQEVRIPLSAFRPMPLLLVPRPYPGFLPLQFQPAQPAFKLTDAEVLQVVVGRRPLPVGSQLHVDIESVSLQ